VVGVSSGREEGQILRDRRPLQPCGDSRFHLGSILWQEGYVMQVLLIPILLEVTVVMPMLATVGDIVRSEQ